MRSNGLITVFVNRDVAIRNINGNSTNYFFLVVTRFYIWQVIIWMQIDVVSEVDFNNGVSCTKCVCIWN